VESNPKELRLPLKMYNDDDKMYRLDANEDLEDNLKVELDKVVDNDTQYTETAKDIVQDTKETKHKSKTPIFVK